MSHGGSVAARKSAGAAPSPSTQPTRRPNTTTSSSGVSYRPTLSQKAKRHVVTISDSLSLRPSFEAEENLALDVVPLAEDDPSSSSVSPQRRYPLRSSTALTPPPAIHRAHVPDASWSSGVLRAQSAHLDEVLDEENLSEVPTAIASPMPVRGGPYIASSIFELRKATPIVSGFDRLDNAIMSLVHRLPESTLEDKFQAISRWLDSYHVDVVPRKLATQLALLLGVGQEGAEGTDEEMFRLASSAAGFQQRTSSALTMSGSLFEGVGSAGNDGSATTLKSIISSAFALHQLILVLVKHKPILGPVAMRTLQAVFNAIYVSKNPLSTMPPELMNFTACRQALQDTLRHFQHRTYFQESRDSQRRMAAVQEFTARYEEVKLRQMASVKRQIDGRSSMWRAVTFMVWRGEVQRAKWERQQSAAMVAVQAENAQVQSRLHALEDTIAKKDATISELRETVKTQSERLELASAAFRYDMMKHTDASGKLRAELDALKIKFAESVATCEALRASLQSNRDALDYQLKQLDAKLWVASSFQRASDVWRSVDGPVSIENASKFVRMLACRSVEANRETWMDPPPPTAVPSMRCSSSHGGSLVLPPAVNDHDARGEQDVESITDGSVGEGGGDGGDEGTPLPGSVPEPPIVEVSALHGLCERYLKEGTSISIPFGHDLLNLLALAMLDLYQGGDDNPPITWYDVQVSFLQCAVLQQKVQCFVKWCRSDTRFPFGPILNDFFLEEESLLAGQAITLEFLQLAISPLRRLSSLTEQARGALNAPMVVSYRPSRTSEPATHNNVDEEGDGVARLVELSADAQARVVEAGTSALQWNPLAALHARLNSFAEGSQVAAACDALLIAQISPRLSWGLLSTATRQLSVVENADRAGFQVSAKDLHAVPTVSAEDEATVRSLHAIINAHVVFLRQAFMSYAGFESGSALSATLSDFGLVKMMRDARIGLPGVVDTPIVKALAGDGLSPKRFVVALIHIAVLRFSKCSAPDALGSLVWRMRSTLNVPSLDSLALSPLRDQWLFCRMMDDVRADMMKVFRRYATESAAGSRITTAEVAKMLQELKLNDDQLTSAEVQEAFSLLGAVQGGLVFEQFVQFLYVVGTLRLRAPWLHRTARVTRFVYDLVLTPLQKKAQLSVVSL